MPVAAATAAAATAAIEARAATATAAAIRMAQHSTYAPLLLAWGDIAAWERLKDVSKVGVIKDVERHPAGKGPARNLGINLVSMVLADSLGKASLAQRVLLLEQLPPPGLACSPRRCGTGSRLHSSTKSCCLCIVVAIKLEQLVAQGCSDVLGFATLFQDVRHHFLLRLAWHCCFAVFACHLVAICAGVVVALNEMLVHGVLRTTSEAAALVVWDHRGAGKGRIAGQRVVARASLATDSALSGLVSIGRVHGGVAAGQHRDRNTPALEIRTV